MKCWPTSKAPICTVDERGVKTQSVMPSLITRAHHTAHGLLKGGGVRGNGDLSLTSLASLLYGSCLHVCDWWLVERSGGSVKADTRLTPFLPSSRRNPVSGGENIGIKQRGRNKKIRGRDSGRLKVLLALVRFSIPNIGI